MHSRGAFPALWGIPPPFSYIYRCKHGFNAPIGLNEAIHGLNRLVNQEAARHIGFRNEKGIEIEVHHRPTEIFFRNKGHRNRERQGLFREKSVINNLRNPVDNIFSVKKVLVRFLGVFLFHDFRHHLGRSLLRRGGITYPTTFRLIRPRMPRTRVYARFRGDGKGQYFFISWSRVYLPRVMSAMRGSLR